MRNLLVTMVLLGRGILLFAADTEIRFHIECYTAASDCVEAAYFNDFGKRILIKSVPEMVITQNEVKSAEFTKGIYDEGNVNVSLSEEAGKKFAEITAANIGKSLAILVGDKAVIAPTIQDSIRGGNFVLQSGANRDFKFLEGVPWLKKMAEEKTQREKNLKLMSMILYILLGLLLIGGAIYFAFFKKSKLPTGNS